MSSALMCRRRLGPWPDKCRNRKMSHPFCVAKARGGVESALEQFATIVENLKTDG
jgi:hypothetical protein